MKMPGKCTGPKCFSKMLEKWGKRHLGGHDLVRSIDRQGEMLIRCRKCSGSARQRMGPTRQVSTKEHGKMLKRIQIPEDGRVPAKEAKHWEIERQNKNHDIRGF